MSRLVQASAVRQGPPGLVGAGLPPPRLGAWSAEFIGQAATLALQDELSLAPKPGLVSWVDSGSHRDMDARTFMRSLRGLHGYFVHMAGLGAASAGFAALEQRGLEAEADMLAATAGVNTHRGAIFMLGLLCAAAGALGLQVDRQGLDVQGRSDLLRQALIVHWGDALVARCQRRSSLPGGLAAHRYGLRSASQEAALGLPVLFETAVPAWTQAGRLGLDRVRLQLQVFFTVMACLDDCNLAHRGGMAGLDFARAQAQGFLARGGAACDAALGRAWAIHRAFVARNLSPGGCADTLSAACFLHRLGLIP